MQSKIPMKSPYQVSNIKKANHQTNKWKSAWFTVVAIRRIHSPSLHILLPKSHFSKIIIKDKTRWSVKIEVYSTTTHQITFEVEVWISQLAWSLQLQSMHKITIVLIVGIARIQTWILFRVDNIVRKILLSTAIALWGMHMLEVFLTTMTQRLEDRCRQSAPLSMQQRTTRR